MKGTQITLGRVAVMATFTVTCFALLLYLWTSFGGPVPLRPQGYRISIDFPDAGRLATQADVRISGVSVGKVVTLSRAGDRTRAVLELKRRYAPLPSDARALLRQKSALGETYVELTPGHRDAPAVADGGMLPTGQVADAVMLDEALKAFDPRTRSDLRAYLAGFAGAVDSRGADISASLSRLAPTEVQATRVLDVLDAQRRAVSGLLNDGGRVLAAVGAREQAVRRLIADGDAVLGATAHRARELRAVVRALPQLSADARATTHEVAITAAILAPALRRLRPAVRELSPLLRALDRGAPELRALVAALGRDYTASATGLPAAGRLLDAVSPLSGALDAPARDLEPALEYVARYKQEIVSPFAVVAAVSQATEKSLGDKPRHYVRLVPNVSDETLTANARRPAADRFNPYPAPRWLDRLASGLEAFSCDHLANVVAAPAPALGTGSPPCRVQPAPLFRGERGAYIHVRRAARRSAR